MPSSRMPRVPNPGWMSRVPRVAEPALSLRTHPFQHLRVTAELSEAQFNPLPCHAFGRSGPGRPLEPPPPGHLPRADGVRPPDGEAEEAAEADAPVGVAPPGGRMDSI